MELNYSDNQENTW